jgi:hypothetical protein
MKLLKGEPASWEEEPRRHHRGRPIREARRGVRLVLEAGAPFTGCAKEKKLQSRIEGAVRLYYPGAPFADVCAFGTIK